MSKMKIKLNSAGVMALLKSAEVGAYVDKCCEQVATNAGEGFEASGRPGRKRYIGEVKAATSSAYWRNLRGNTLLKALHL